MKPLVLSVTIISTVASTSYAIKRRLERHRAQQRLEQEIGRTVEKMGERVDTTSLSVELIWYAAGRNRRAANTCFFLAHTSFTMEERSKHDACWTVASEITSEAYLAYAHSLLLEPMYERLVELVQALGDSRWLNRLNLRDLARAELRHDLEEWGMDMNQIDAALAAI